MTTARFEGRRVLLSGAGSGIGRATARLFTREGARVLALVVDADLSSAHPVARPRKLAETTF